MSVVAILLVCASAGIHAAWNLAGKRAKPEPAFFLVATAVGSAVLAPTLLLFRSVAAAMPAGTWRLVVVTGLFQALYFTGLAGAYRRGDLSIVYPVARSLPVLIVPAITLALGLGGRIGPAAMAGMVLITVGMLVLPQNTLRPRLERWRGGWLAYACLAALGTSGYSIIDDQALTLFRDATVVLAAGPGAGVFISTQATLVYAFWETAFTVVWLLILGFVIRGPARFIRNLAAVPRKSAVSAGVGILLAYTIVLVAMGYATNVGYIVAFRQLSIPLGALFGMVALKEEAPAPKVLGVVGITAGLVLVAVG